VQDLSATAAKLTSTGFGMRLLELLHAVPPAVVYEDLGSHVFHTSDRCPLLRTPFLHRTISAGNLHDACSPCASCASIRLSPLLKPLAVASRALQVFSAPASWGSYAEMRRFAYAPEGSIPLPRSTPLSLPVAELFSEWCASETNRFECVPGGRWDVRTLRRDEVTVGLDDLLFALCAASLEDGDIADFQTGRMLAMWCDTMRAVLLNDHAAVRLPVLNLPGTTSNGSMLRSLPSVDHAERFTVPWVGELVERIAVAPVDILLVARDLTAFSAGQVAERLAALAVDTQSMVRSSSFAVLRLPPAALPGLAGIKGADAIILDKGFEYDQLVRACALFLAAPQRGLARCWSAVLRLDRNRRRLGSASAG
jgi:hypothetical protein